VRALALGLSIVGLAVAAPVAVAQDVPVDPGTGGAVPGGGTGGAVYGVPFNQKLVPGTEAKVINGVAYAPTGAPPEVQKAIWAANKIQGKPYRYGGGHKAFSSSGYDCSGTVSYALHGGGLLDEPLDSSQFMKWGERGPGEWITVYTNPGHAFVIIAGLRLDTSGNGGSGPRWRLESRSTRGYKARHPLGF
jgi:hypothetical protein